MKFAPVGNIHLLYRLHVANLLGRYHLLLAHDVVGVNAPYYRTLFKEIRATDEYTKHVRWFITMDNSLIELGRAMKGFELIDAVKTTRANALVLPDKLEDTDQTVDLSLEAAKDFDKHLPSYCSFMYVVQGKTFDELFDGVARVLHHPRIEYLAVPRICTKRFGTRRDIIHALYTKYPHIPMHLLGFSDDLVDDLMCASLPGVMGIDSAEPVWRGMLQESITQPIHQKRPQHYLECALGDYEWGQMKQKIRMNINYVRKALVLNARNARTKVVPDQSWAGDPHHD